MSIFTFIQYFLNFVGMQALLDPVFISIYRGKIFTFFFDVMQKDKLCSIMMEGKLKEEGLNSTVKVIKNEMKAVKKLKMSVREVTPEFLYAFDFKHDMTLPFTQMGPIL